MFDITLNPISYFNHWFRDPIISRGASVACIIESLNGHGLCQDETAQNYVMPLRRCFEKAGRYRLYGEEQDTFYCFIYEGNETQEQPPVYFETCLDLTDDYGVDPSTITNGDHVMVCQKFSDFLWYLLGHHICLRLKSNNQFQTGVSGTVFSQSIILEAEFVNPLGKPFPAGYSVYLSEDTICIPDWGAAFRNPASRDIFLKRYNPVVRSVWS